MVTVKLSKIKQTNVDITQIKNMFKKCGFSCVHVSLHSLQKDSIKTTHFSLLKSPHVHKKAVSQYALSNDVSFSVQLSYESLNTLSLNKFLHRLTLRSFFSATRALLSLNAVGCYFIQNQCFLLLSNLRTLELNGTSIKGIKATRSVVFTVYS